MHRTFRAPDAENRDLARQASSPEIGRLFHTIGQLVSLAPRQYVEQDFATGDSWLGHFLPGAAFLPIRGTVVPARTFVSGYDIQATRCRDPRTGKFAKSGVVASAIVGMTIPAGWSSVEYTITYDPDAPHDENRDERYTIERAAGTGVPLRETAPGRRGDYTQLDPNSYGDRLEVIEHTGAKARDMGLRTVSSEEVAALEAAVRPPLHRYIADIALLN